MKSRSFPQLHKVTALVRYAYGCRVSEIRGIKDTYQKLMACYIAKQVSGLDDRSISLFFQINEVYMNNRLQNVSIDLLMDPETETIVEELIDLYCELELADVKNI